MLLTRAFAGRDKHTSRTGSQSRHKRPLAKPPFETLLNPAGGATEVLEEEEEEAVDPSSLVIPRGRDLPRPVDVEGRTPLPLFESEKGNDNQRRTKRT